MTINALIDQYNAAETEAQKRLIKNQIYFNYYHASADERSAARVAMQPFFDEIQQEMIEKDPLARQTYEMFKRFEASKAVAGR